MLITPIPTREVCKLLKTGQVTSYVDYDDAYYANLGLGIAKEYLILTDDQFDGTTDIVLNEKTDVHSNNCVLDLKTGLMWSRYVSASVGPNSDGKLPWTTNENDEGIFPYVVAANEADLAEYSDWRIVNARECMDIANFENVGCVPDSIAFPDFPYEVWTSTTNKNLTDHAEMFLDSYFKDILLRYPKTELHYCLLVRGG